MYKDFGLMHQWIQFMWINMILIINIIIIMFLKLIMILKTISPVDRCLEIWHFCWWWFYCLCNLWVGGELLDTNCRIDDSYKGVTGRYSRVLVGLMNEAPTMFKYKSKYYMITSGLKGFSPTDARSSYSDNIFGPWVSLGNPVRSDDVDHIKKLFPLKEPS